MAIGHATADLGFDSTHRNTFMDLLLRCEAWLDRRRTSKILYQLDDLTLADIGLSRADVEGLNEASWPDHLPPPISRRSCNKAPR
jgi:uncharacterized protein YjiS (DUF1127 family)